MDWPSEAIEAFASAIVEETDRLTGLVENLLDMSRLRAGAVDVRRIAVGAEELVPAALESLGDVARRRPIEVDVPETLPRVDTDPALVERALVEPGRERGRVGARRLPGPDRGGGGRAATSTSGSSTVAPVCPPADRDRIFQPFQRLGDRSSGAGVGLGLAVARGFVEAVGGELTAEDTPGGGTTMVITLPLRTRAAPIVAEPA